MAMIDEGGMLRVMKDAYKATGYIVINDAGTVTIRTGVWMTQMPFRVLPRKVLALLVEHIGTIPEDKAAFRCSKGWRSTDACFRNRAGEHAESGGLFRRSDADR